MSLWMKHDKSIYHLSYHVSSKLHILSRHTQNLNRQSQFIIWHADKDNKLLTRPSFAIKYKDVLIFDSIQLVGLLDRTMNRLWMHHTSVKLFSDIMAAHRARLPLQIRRKLQTFVRYFVLFSLTVVVLIEGYR